MALLSYLPAALTGLNAAAPPASGAGGDTIAPNDRGMVAFRNGDATAKTITLVVPGNTKYGQANPDVAYIVPAGQVQPIGPLTADLADPTTGLISFTYSAVTSCTTQAFSF